MKVDLALRAVAVAEGIEVGDDDLDAEYERIAIQVQQKAKQVKKAYEANDAVTDLMSQIRKSKALDWLVHHVQIVDADGEPIDRDLILGDTHDAGGGLHDDAVQAGHDGQADHDDHDDHQH